MDDSATTDMTELVTEMPSSPAMARFEGIYRANVGAISAFFERRCDDPQEVADLTSETFVEAIRCFAAFDTRRGTARAWLFGIARHRFARHCEQIAHGRALQERVRGAAPLAEDVREEIEARIDAQRAGRGLLERCAAMSDLDRSAIELVDLDGLSPSEAASVLKVNPTTLRVRLFRARARLRKEFSDDQPV
jgi:RNA polymerase sigma factor (sigma-70 family)